MQARRAADRADIRTLDAAASAAGVPLPGRLAVPAHLFEEPGTLDHVAGLARDWFVRHLVPPGAGPAQPGGS